MLAPELVDRIQQTLPLLKENGEQLTQHFYARMFRHDPEVQSLFNPAHQHAGTQQKALAAAICAYAEHIEEPAALQEALELIAHKHVSLGIKPSHYPIVGRHLLASIREVAGEAATDDILEAWAQAYDILADTLIQREAEIYAEQRRRHGWQGFTRFQVDRKQRESAIITSFYLRPEDGSPTARFEPGQFLTVRVPGRNGGTTMRNYSLSNHPDDPHYRISVKREPAESRDVPPGYVSSYLHDELQEGNVLEVAPPCGVFTLDVDTITRDPLVFIAGGVGVTPLLSMLRVATEAELDRDIWFIHGVNDGDVQAFGEEVRQIAARHPRLHVHFRYAAPTTEDREQARFDSTGLLDANLVAALIGRLEADFYLCGPTPMLANLHPALVNRGADPNRIHYEFFGPAQELAAPAQEQV